MSRLDEIEQRAAQATPGPWTSGSGCVYSNGLSVTDGVFEYIVDEFRRDHEPNAQFIAHAREDIPWLVAEVRKAKEEIAKLCDALTAEHRFTDDLQFELIHLKKELQYLADGCACVGEFPCCKNCIATQVAQSALESAAKTSPDLPAVYRVMLKVRSVTKGEP